MSDLPYLDQLGDEFARRAHRDEAKQQRRRLLPGRWAVPALAAAALAVIILGAVGIAPDASPTGLADRAFAAVSPKGEIVHTVQDITIHENGDLQLHQRSEQWWDGERKRSVTGKVTNGQIVPLTEMVVDGDIATTYLVTSDQLRRETRNFLGGQPQDDPIAVFRELHRQGKVKSAGTATFEGRDVQRLIRREGDGQLRTWLVDPETFQPLAYRMIVGDADRPAFAYTVRYLTYERLERTPQNEARLEMSPHPGAQVTDEPVKPTDIG